MSTKTNPGRFFEDFRVGQEIVHATPRTLNDGDAALYTALYGGRFALQSADPFAEEIGYPRSPLDDLLVFHTVFGKSVAGISLNAVANLGYAEGRFFKPVYPGSTLWAESQIIGVKENSNGRTGVVYVRTTGYDDLNEPVLSYVRWVMVNKRHHTSPAPDPVVPTLHEFVPASDLAAPEDVDFSQFDEDDSGSALCWDDYEIGEKIDHVDGVTVEEADHMLATRLYQNTARVHLDQYAQSQGHFGRRLIYGGHVISLARSLSFNGLANAFTIAAINAGRHVAPLFAGDTVYAWSEVLDKAWIDGRGDCGALRLRLVATKNAPCVSFPYKDAGEEYLPEVVLDFDYWALMPRASAA